MRSLFHGSMIAAALGGAAVLELGCTPETGILIQVTAPEEVWQAAVPSGGSAVLELYMGAQDQELSQVPTATACGATVQYRQRDDLPGVRQVLEGRNLAREPFTLFLRPDDALGQPPELMVVATVAVSREATTEPGERALSAASPQPLVFKEGQLQRWTLELGPAVLDSTSECLCTSTGTTTAILSTGLDPDCDGYYGASDCGPENPLQHPGAVELCDGLDTNCDPSDEPVDSLRCVQRDPSTSQCGTGWLECVDDETAGLSASDRRGCAESGRELVGPAPDTLCQAYMELQLQPDPFQAAVDQVYAQARTLACWVPLDKDGRVCAEASALLFSHTPADVLDCSWSLVGGSRQQHYTVEVSPYLDGVDGDPGTSLLCPARLVIGDSGQSGTSREDVLLLWSERAITETEGALEYVRVKLLLGERGDCSQLRMECTEL